MDRQGAGRITACPERKAALAASRSGFFAALPISWLLGEYPLLHAYIGMRSLTYAQRAAGILENRGVRARAARAPWTGSGCAWCVRIPAAEAGRAPALLREAGLRPESLYLEGEDGVLRERKL